METNSGYGVVYTPELLADFTSRLLAEELSHESSMPITVVDPSCGEGALLRACEKQFTQIFGLSECHYIGVDVDSAVIEKNRYGFFEQQAYNFKCFDAIMPQNGNKSVEYWHEFVPRIDAIIANPPWSSDRIYTREELQLAGFRFERGQYDSYVLFVELCLRIVKPNGCCAFILPDSLFSGENKSLRKYLAENVQICTIARLGEKLFPGVNRAATILVVRNSKPNSNSETKCFRLTTELRNQFLSGDLDLSSEFLKARHFVLQKRFLDNPAFSFDIDVTRQEEGVLRKIELDRIDWGSIFHFGRGVEVSKSGVVAICTYCHNASGVTRKQLEAKEKPCPFCDSLIQLNEGNIRKIVFEYPKENYIPILVGENVRRYSEVGRSYIVPGVTGVNYKAAKLYEPPKILVRKTGLGINAMIDYSSTYISQTVYSCNFLSENNQIPLEYYLGVLNSRLMYYYYIKSYGENEWKSHPYITKEIVFSLPLKRVSEQNEALCGRIAGLAKKMMRAPSRKTDMAIESLVWELYNLNEEDRRLISIELNKLPNLGAINQMKIQEDENV